MRSLGLTRLTGVAFAVLMAMALAVLAYAGWRIGTNDRVPAVDWSPTPSRATAVDLPIAPCDPPEPDASIASGASAPPDASPAPRSVYAAERFAVGARGAHALAYVGGDRTLLVGRAAGDGMHLGAFTLFGDSGGSRRLGGAPDGKLAADRASGHTLFTLDGSGTILHLVELMTDGTEALSGGVDLSATGVSHVSGLDVDESTSSILLVDPAASRLLRVAFSYRSPGAEPRWEIVSACAISLPVLRDAEDVLVAVRPGDGAIFLSRAGDAVLYELGSAGATVASYDLSSIGVRAVRALAFAPSADPGDPESVENLYILDEQASHAEVVAVTFEPPVEPPVDVPTVAATVVQSIDLATQDPPSSDSGGVTYDLEGERVIVTDSDIDELPDYAGSVIFARGIDGSWQELGTPAELHEVTDVAIDAAGNRWFFSDDGRDLLMVFDLGPDATFGTRDDRATRISTSAFGNDDPEGLAYGQGSLFVTDGAGAEVYRLSPGENGEFDGAGARSDDSVTSFDTAVHGLSDPEGIAYDPARGTLYVVGRDQEEPVIEVGTDGRLIRRITLPEDLLVSPGGIAMMPPTESGDLRLLIADRGADNASSTAPNDGRLIEIEVSSPAPAR